MFSSGVRDRLRAVHALAAEQGGETPHAHDYVISWSCSTRELDGRGFAIDIALLKACLRGLCAALEDKDLNAIPFFASRPPSVENVAVFLSRELARRLGDAGDSVVRSEITIWESDDAWASYVEERDPPRPPRRVP